MPLPERPSSAILIALAEAHREAKDINKISSTIEPRIRAWMTKSFPNSKIFENRVHSLTNLVTAIVLDWRPPAGEK